MWPCCAHRAISDGAFTAQITDLIVHPSWRVNCTPCYTVLASRANHCILADSWTLSYLDSIAIILTRVTALNHVNLCTEARHWEEDSATPVPAEQCEGGRWVHCLCAAARAHVLLEVRLPNEREVQGHETLQMSACVFCMKDLSGVRIADKTPSVVSFILQCVNSRLPPTLSPPHKLSWLL